MKQEITPLPWAEEGDRITGQNGRLLASVWSRRVTDCQEPGESWLAMRERTQPERDAADAEMHANAAFIVKAVNAHDQLLAALKAIIGACDACCDDDDKSLIDEFTADMEVAARRAIAAVEGK